MPNQPSRLFLGIVKHAPAAAGSIAMVAGAAALVGWVLDIRFLTSLSGKLPTMAPETAALCLIAGGGLWFRGSTNSLGPQLGQCAAFLVCLVSAAVAGEHAGLWSRSAALLTANLPQPAMLTTASFLLIGIALASSRRRLIDWVAGFSLLIGLLALIGYTCNVPSFYRGIPPWTGGGMALNTTLVSCLLSFGLLALPPRTGLMAIVTSASASGVLARRLLLAPVIIPTATGWLKVLGLWLGIYNAEVAAWLFAFLNIAIFTLVIWWSAALLHRSETEQLRAEDSVRELNAELEERVQVRTAQLSEALRERQHAEARLQQAHELLGQEARHLDKLVRERTKKLEAALGDLEAFSYSVSHDLRAPLRSMQGFAQLLMEDHSAGLPAEAADYLRRIQVSASRMDQLVMDVLAYSHVARSELELKAVDLSACLTGILHSYPNLHRAQIELTNPLPSVRANEAALTQCLSNLLGNAVKFVAPGVQPRVRVWAEQSNRRVRVHIADNGIGIHEEAQGQLFQMFQRLDRSYEGTGMGLAIVKKAAERMGGAVGITSTPGQGSTFWVELAAAPQASPVGNLNPVPERRLAG